ncbi:hypothetical protein N7470_003382 [Penicillium chermesinum]|nr:hypothetical protein N7470_003382 [Penicillium chermesinum]
MLLQMPEAIGTVYSFGDDIKGAFIIEGKRWDFSAPREELSADYLPLFQSRGTLSYKNIDDLPKPHGLYAGSIQDGHIQILGENGTHISGMLHEPIGQAVTFQGGGFWQMAE